MRNGKTSKPVIPDKLYFKIGEVSAISGLPTYVLRFWETEFSKINPKRTSSGQRLYRKNDVELILEIKHLLYDKKFTIPGAKKHMNIKTRGKNKKPTSEVIAEIRQELEEIRDLLA
jgi:DNA-binding transcriptional MerR regulator